MNWSLHDTVFTGRSFGGYATSLVREWKVGGGNARVPAHFTLGVWRVSGAFSDVLVITGLGCVFHSGTSEIM